MSFTDCSCSLAGTRYCDICESNPNKGTLRITSPRFSEFASNIVVEGVKYHVQTENLSTEKTIILTCVFRAGEMVLSKKLDYGHLVDNASFNEKLHKLMSDQHLSVISTIKAEEPRERKMVSVYLKEVKNLIRVDDLKGALRTLDEALTAYPFNALLLSYYGCLDAVVNKNYERSVDLCKTAIEIYKEESREEESLGRDVLYAVFYLHLGRVYLAAGMKKFAVEAFKKGLEADPEHPDLLREVRRIGIRRKPIFSLLKRSNPINKYIGMRLRNS